MNISSFNLWDYPIVEDKGFFDIWNNFPLLNFDIKEIESIFSRSIKDNLKSAISKIFKEPMSGFVKFEESDDMGLLMGMCGEMPITGLGRFTKYVRMVRRERGHRIDRKVICPLLLEDIDIKKRKRISGEMSEVIKKQRLVWFLRVFDPTSETFLEFKNTATTLFGKYYGWNRRKTTNEDFLFAISQKLWFQNTIKSDWGKFIMSGLNVKMHELNVNWGTYVKGVLDVVASNDMKAKIEGLKLLKGALDICESEEIKNKFKLDSNIYEPKELPERKQNELPAYTRDLGFEVEDMTMPQIDEMGDSTFGYENSVEKIPSEATMEAQVVE